MVKKERSSFWQSPGLKVQKQNGAQLYVPYAILTSVILTVERLEPTCTLNE